MMPATQIQRAKRSEACGAEGRHGTLLGRDIHGLDNEEIVVERDDGVDQGDEHEDVDRYRTLREGRGEDEELAEESGERGIPARENMASIMVKARRGWCGRGRCSLPSTRSRCCFR